MIKYRSTLEESIAKDLKNKKVKFKYEDASLDYTLYRKYTPDFILPNGIYIECKGWHRNLGEALRKLRVVREQHPEIDLRIVWSKLDMKVTKTMTAKDWSKKYKFKYAEKLVPFRWVNE